MAAHLNCFDVAKCTIPALQAAASYLEALQALQPPLTAQSTWEERGGTSVPESPAYSVLNDRRREQVRKVWGEAVWPAVLVWLPGRGRIARAWCLVRVRSRPARTPHLI